MITKKLVKRFDQYFGNSNNPKKQELRRYIEEHSRLVTESPDAYVPRIFVCWWMNPSHLTTAIAWGLNYRIVLPPTDFIFLKMDSHFNSNQFTTLGYAKTENLIEKLNPYLERIDSYTFTKKLTSEYRYAYENDEFMEPIIQNVPIPFSTPIEFGRVDIIPPIEEVDCQDVSFELPAY